MAALGCCSAPPAIPPGAARGPPRPEAWAGVPVPLTWMRSSVGTAQPSKGVRSTVPTASASSLGPCI